MATITLVGDDDDGRFLMAEADRLGIDRARMQVTSAAPTHFTECYTAKLSGRRTHITCRGSASLLTPDHFDFSDVPHRFLHLGLPGVHELMDGPIGGEVNGWVAVLKKARAAGLETNLELASIARERLIALVRPCLPQLDLLIVNDHEIAAVAGHPEHAATTVDVAGSIAAAKDVLTAGAMKVAVVHFPMGAVAVARDGTVATRPSVNVPPGEVVGANGAGDAFAAGFLYAYHQGRGLEDCLTLAHASAAASLRAMTTAGAIVAAAECIALANRWGWRPPLL